MPVPDPTGPDEPGDPPGEGTTCGYYEGTCEGGSCAGTFACTEAGIREAIAAGAGPHTFGCNGATTVVTEAEIVIDKDVIIDGEGKLTVDGDDVYDVIRVDENATAEIRGFRITGSGCGDLSCGAGIAVFKATFTLANSTVSDNWTGVANQDGTVTLLNSTVSGNLPNISSYGELGVLKVIDSTISGGSSAGPTSAGGVYSCGAQLMMLNSTVSGNEGVGIVHYCQGTATLTNCTITDNASGGLSVGDDATVTLRSTIVDDGCAIEVGASTTSEGYNIESPGNTCGFDQGTDQVDVAEGQLNLGELAANGGPTMTHALEAGSVAIDVIPEDDCVDAEGELLAADQRGEPRFVGLPFGPLEPVGDGCDVGAFEVQP
jgi:hypothetical protein